jgi:hypothetical protein
MIVLSAMRGGMLPLIPKLGNAVYGDYWSVSRFWLGDWRYSSTISDLSTRWWRVISLVDILIFNTSEHEESLGFWTLSIVRNSKYKKTERFGNWIRFRPQMKGMGTSTLLGPAERALQFCSQNMKFNNTDAMPAGSRY